MDDRRFSVVWKWRAERVVNFGNAGMRYRRKEGVPPKNRRFDAKMINKLKTGESIG
jgi:hypothetical protein